MKAAMAIPFRDALLARVTAGTSLKAIADGSGVSYEQLKKVKQRSDAKTSADDAVRIAAFFGMTLNEFVDDHLAEDRAAAVATYSRLTEQERRFLQAASKGLDALDRADKSK